MHVIGSLGGHLAALRTDVPVVPDAETAREWARAELSNPIYNERRSLFDVVLEWLRDLVAEVGSATSAMDGRLAAIVVVSLLVLGALVALVVAGPVRRSQRSQRASVDVFGDDTRTATQLRASADALAAEGRWGEAVLDRFRAILRGLEDRVLLDERPGRTAHEAAEAAGRRLPTCAGDLERAGRLFDDVCYGDAAADADDDRWLREVDTRVAATRPTPTAADAPAETETLGAPR